MFGDSIVNGSYYALVFPSLIVKILHPINYNEHWKSFLIGLALSLCAIVASASGLLTGHAGDRFVVPAVGRRSPWIVVGYVSATLIRFVAVLLVWLLAPLTEEHPTLSYPLICGVVALNVLGDGARASALMAYRLLIPERFPRRWVSAIAGVQAAAQYLGFGLSTFAVGAVYSLVPVPVLVGLILGLRFFCMIVSLAAVHEPCHAPAPLEPLEAFGDGDDITEDSDEGGEVDPILDKGDDGDDGSELTLPDHALAVLKNKQLICLMAARFGVDLSFALLSGQVMYELRDFAPDFRVLFFTLETPEQAAGFLLHNGNFLKKK